MNVVLLITVTFTLALVRGNNQPCLKNNDNNAYNKFVHKHILQDSFNRGSVPAWEMYISNMKLCNRPKQSFFEGSDQGRVEQICNGDGYPLAKSGPGNLCMSTSILPGYYIEVDNNCKVKRLVPTNTNVIVACDVVQNQCRPVHFEKYNNQKPDTKAKPCKP